MAQTCWQRICSRCCCFEHLVSRGGGRVCARVKGVACRWDDNPWLLHSRAADEYYNPRASSRHFRAQAFPGLRCHHLGCEGQSPGNFLGFPSNRLDCILALWKTSVQGRPQSSMKSWAFRHLRKGKEAKGTEDQLLKLHFPFFQKRSGERPSWGDRGLGEEI